MESLPQHTHAESLPHHHPLSHTLVAHQSAGDVKTLAANNHDLLALKQLLRNHRGQAAHEVTAGVDHDDLFVH